MIETILSSLPLKVPTKPAWSKMAVDHVDAFLLDHASCERKAHAAAIMLVNRFPEHTLLQDRMIRLAHEELTHFQQVLHLLRDRNLILRSDEVDIYVKELMKLVRHPQDLHLLDRLLVAALIEARSCERFCLFARALPQGDLQTFYENFAREESAHFPLFVETAKIYYPAAFVDQELERWLEKESQILDSQPLKPTVH